MSWGERGQSGLVKGERGQSDCLSPSLIGRQGAVKGILLTLGTRKASLGVFKNRFYPRGLQPEGERPPKRTSEWKPEAAGRRSSCRRRGTAESWEVPDGKFQWGP